jgi:hypothetical protein
MSKPSPRLPDDVRELLSECPLPWHIETGTRHFKVVINDRLAAILPKGKNLRGAGGYSDRAMKNTLAQLRRTIRNHTHHRSKHHG